MGSRAIPHNACGVTTDRPAGRQAPEACYIAPPKNTAPKSNPILRVTVHSSLDSLPESARLLCASAGRSRWFQSLEWFQCLHSTALGSAVRPRVYVVSDDSGAAVACFFCCTRGDDDRELASMSNYYTMEFSPVVRDDSDAQGVCATLVTYISEERPRWHTVRLDYLKESNSTSAALIDALGQAGFTALRHHQYENWYLDCPSMGFDEYFAARPSRLRNTIERKGRKLYKAHQVEFVLYRHVTDDIERGVRDYIAVYNSSWKQPEPHPAFIPDLARRLVANDALRLGVLYADGKPVAAQFWITTDSEACIYKLAYDEKFAELSVGAVLSREMFRQALDADRAKRIDYGVGSESYKREWMSASQEIFGVRAHSRKTALGLGKILAARLRAQAKRLAAKLAS